MSDDHQHWSDDVAGYLLGALEPTAAAELERHLAGCRRCREEMRRLGPPVQALPESIDIVEPPRRLRAQLLAEVRADAREAGPSEAAEHPWLGVGRRLRALRRGRFGWWPAAGLATLVLAVAAVAGYELGNQGSAPDRGSVVTGRTGPVKATVTTEDQGGTLRLSNVPHLPRDRVLEAWVQREGKVEPVRALFVPDRSGHASTTIGDMRGVEAVMVTAEPQGGSGHPTSKPIVTVTLPE
jgi:anti-sigma-K factor RskA